MDLESFSGLEHKILKISLVKRFTFCLKPEELLVLQMTELEKIEALGSLDVIKAKRAHRRGRITRLRGRIEALISEPLRNLQLEELEAVN